MARFAITGLTMGFMILLALDGRPVSASHVMPVGECSAEAGCPYQAEADCWTDGKWHLMKCGTIGCVG